jgi:uncharacterized protein YhfF
MWEKYLSSVEETQKPRMNRFNAWHFSNNREIANELADLVLKGIKRGTTSSLLSLQQDNEPIPEAGDYSVITDYDGNAQCIIRTTEITITPFNLVTSDFAAIEGEGDKSLEYWQKVHRRCITEELGTLGISFSEDTPVICEKFEVVYP